MKKASSVFLGIILIVVGVIFLGNLFELWNIKIFFNGWWTLLIIIPSIYGLFKKEWISSSLGIIIGVLLLLACRDYIEWSVVGKAFLPALLIIIGLSFIFKPKMAVSYNEKGLPEYIGVFSDNELKIKDVFKGSDCVAVFGGVDLDLTEAKITKDIKITCVSVFGGIDIKLPENVKTKVSGVPIFGETVNKAIQKDGPTILIDYVCIFSGITIK